MITEVVSGKNTWTRSEFLTKPMETWVMSVWLWTQGPGTAGGWHHYPWDPVSSDSGEASAQPPMMLEQQTQPRGLWGLSCFHCYSIIVLFLYSLPSIELSLGIVERARRKENWRWHPGNGRLIGKPICSPKRAICWDRPLPPGSS